MTGTVPELTPPVIVLGMHRSGTSLLTGRLEAAGLFLGKVNVKAPHNLKGNRENPTLRIYHDKMLKARGLDWKTPPEGPIDWTPEEVADVEEILANYAQQPLWGFKDPRTIWFLDHYLARFPEAKLIGTVRHPESVATSLNVRAEALRMSMEEGRALWRKTNAKLLEISRARKLTLVRFGDSGVADPLYHEPFNRFVSELGLSPSAPEFYDDSLHHHAATADFATAEDRALWEQLMAVVEAGR